MKLLTSILKPEFIFRPSQILRRILFEIDNNKHDTQVLTLPWGLAIDASTKETIGSSIARQGLFELTVSELLWRLCEPGETAVDVGANIGHMTSVMALKVGNQGKTFCFEPHPVIFPRLQNNVARWQTKKCLGKISISNHALSNQKGSALLSAAEDFNKNQGTASLETIPNNNITTYKVDLDTMDSLFANEQIGVMKIDVEGHELSVFQGAVKMLEDRKIRDIVFEEHSPAPTPVTEFLQEYGFYVFFVEKKLTGLKLHPIDNEYDIPKGEAPTYLATLEPHRAHRRLVPYGYKALTQAKCKY